MKHILSFVVAGFVWTIASSCCGPLSTYLDSALCAEASFLSSVDQSLYGNEPVGISSSGGESEKRLPPQQIVGEPGGGQQNDQSEGTTFVDVLRSPTFHVGPTISWLGGDKEENEKFPAKPGFQVGAAWHVPITPALSLEPGIGYSNRGLGYKSEESGYYEPGGGGSYGYSYGQNKRLHYLELPIFASASIANGLDLFGGPQVGFLLGAKTTNQSDGETTSTERGKKGFNGVDVGISAGVRYQIPKTFFNVSLGYYHGFSNLSSGSEYGYGYDEPKYMTRSARLGVQYNFPAARSHAASAGNRSAKSWLLK